MISLKNKKVLVMGLGALGGGVATTKWLLKQGALVTVTDLKTRKELAPSIKALGAAAKKVRFVLGEHRKEDFRTHDFIVVNPGVPRESPYLRVAKKAGARIINDAVLFFEFLPKENPIIAVTGTRGKTTTTNFIAHLLKARWPQVRPAGNTPENPLLKELERLKKHPGTPAILELSSWQLEYLPETKRAPDVAVITNFYPDHMNRYGSMKEYARAKANIFLHQTKGQTLIINPQAKSAFRVLYSSKLRTTFAENAENKTGAKEQIFVSKPMASAAKVVRGKVLSDIIWFDANFTSITSYDLVNFVRSLGEHNVSNFAAALLAARVLIKKHTGRELSEGEVRKLLPSLSRALPRFRQEVILKKNGLLIINDSTSTSPEAAIAALRRFSTMAYDKKLPLFFITGGTDKGLSYAKLVSAIRAKRTLFDSWGLPFHLYLLEGSATNGICKYLKMTIFKDLRTIVRDIIKRIGSTSTSSVHNNKGIIVFSPGAASFEKFKNEFDRGEQFTRIVKKYFVV